MVGMVGIKVHNIRHTSLPRLEHGVQVVHVLPRSEAGEAVRFAPAVAVPLAAALAQHESRSEAETLAATERAEALDAVRLIPEQPQRVSVVSLCYCSGAFNICCCACDSKVCCRWLSRGPPLQTCETI